MNRKIFLWLVICTILLQSVLSLGIAPAKTAIISEERSSYHGTITVLNTDHTNINANLFVEGPLKDFIKLQKKKVSLNPNQEEKKVKFKVDLPPNLPPGDTLSYIVVEQSLFSLEENVVSSKVALKHKVIVKGPYPDKFVETKLNFHKNPKKVKLAAEISNKGRKDLEKVQTRFYVNDQEQKTHELSTEEVSIATKETKILSSEIDRQLVSQGEFEVKAVTTYDDLTVELSKVMVIGEPEIDITYFNPYFIANKINQYSLELKNRWNKKAENVYVDVEVNKNNKKIDQFRTKSTEIEGLTSDIIEDYFDARDKDEGKYRFDFVVNFLNKYRMDKKEFQVEFLSEEEFKEIDITGAATIGENSFSKPTAILLILIIIIIGTYVIYRYIHRDEYE